jgi:hypothetical protein
MNDVFQGLVFLFYNREMDLRCFIQLETTSFNPVEKSNLCLTLKYYSFTQLEITSSRCAMYMEFSNSEKFAFFAF